MVLWDGIGTDQSSQVSVYLHSPIWGFRALSRSSADGSVPHAPACPDQSSQVTQPHPLTDELTTLLIRLLID